LTIPGYNPGVSEPIEQPINAATRYCAVYGHPVKHSASPAMQNAGLAALGLNWRYLAFDVLPDQLREALAGAKVMGYVGVNLTVPHKLLAVNIVDQLDTSAQTWGAVNTVRFEGRNDDGAWLPLREFNETPRELRSHGFNTDADAITRSLRQDLRLELKGLKVLLLGAGGAGRTAALKLASENVSDLFLVNRTESKAAAVAKEIGSRFPAVRTVLGYPPGVVDLVLNATSLGLAESDPLPFEPQRFSFRGVSSVYDMIYRPAQTNFLKVAAKAGCRTSNGLGMLLYQGAKALELWTGQAAPVSAMRTALERNIYG
jgi:shikimate dehydrogenase